MSIVVIADWLAADGQEQRVADLLPALTEAVLAEPGALGFRAVRSRRDPAAFVLFEEYADAASLEAHRATDHFRDLVQETIAPLLIDRQVEVYSTI